MPNLVAKAELLWVLDAYEPATSSDLGEHLPIDGHSVYVRLRHFYRDGFVERSDEKQNGTAYLWWLTETGREWLAAQDLPDIDTVDLATVFAGRTDMIDDLMILQALALEDGEWHPSRVVYDALPFTRRQNKAT